MSLFDKLNNKRYDLQERKKKISSSASSGNNNSNKNISTSRRNIKKAISDLEATQPGGETPKIETGRTTYNKNKDDFQKGKDELIKNNLRNKDRLNREYDAYDDGDLGNPNDSKGYEDKTKTKTKTVNQAEVSKQAKDFTKKINKKNKNLNPSTKANYPKTKSELIAKRKEYGIDRKGNISDAGIKRYAEKTKQLSSGSNVPAKITQADMDLAKKRAVGTGVKGTDVGKYGGTLSRKRRSDAKSLDQVKRDIEVRPYKEKLKKKYKVNRQKQRTIQKKLRIDKAIARSGESSIKFRDTARTIAKKIPGLTRTVTTPAVTNKVGKVLTPVKTKTALKPIVKKAITLTQKAGPGGAVVAGGALALLNPSIRKGARRIATAALGAAGIKAFTSKPKVASRPPTSIGINLSSGKNKSTSTSKYAAERIKQLAKDSSKVANKNLA